MLRAWTFVLMAPLLVTSFGVPAQQPPHTTVEHARAVLADLVKGDAEAVLAHATDRVKAALPPERLSSTWNGIVQLAGPFKEVTNASEADVNGMHLAVLTCAFARATLEVRITFDAEWQLAGLFMRAASAAAAPYKAPSYVDPSAFTESDVTVGGGEWALPGALTLPKGDGPFPAVVLVHGSGPNDRDETVGAEKPFRDLAEGLATRGIAVLRYDKRSKVQGPAMAALPSMTVKDEVVDDAVAAATELARTPKIDAARIFVLGHSLGGMLVPRIGTADPDLAGLIVLAGAARPLQRAIVDQTRYLAQADGTISPDEQKQINELEKAAAEIDALTPTDATSSRSILGAPPSYWLDLRNYDAPAAAARLKQPLLVLQGERDYQVTMDEFARWKQALAGKPNATARSFPGLNHLFIAGTGKSLPAEYNTPGHVSDEVVAEIAAWIKRIHAGG